LDRLKPCIVSDQRYKDESSFSAVVSIQSFSLNRFHKGDPPMAQKVSEMVANLERELEVCQESWANDLKVFIKMAREHQEHTLEEEAQECLDNLRALVGQRL
jgi:hypothetical protein